MGTEMLEGRRSALHTQLRTQRSAPLPKPSAETRVTDVVTTDWTIPVITFPTLAELDPAAARSVEKAEPLFAAPASERMTNTSAAPHHANARSSHTPKLIGVLSSVIVLAVALAVILPLLR